MDIIPVEKLNLITSRNRKREKESTYIVRWFWSQLRTFLLGYDFNRPTLIRYYHVLLLGYFSSALLIAQLAGCHSNNIENAGQWDSNVTNGVILVHRHVGNERGA